MVWPTLGSRTAKEQELIWGGAYAPNAPPAYGPVSLAISGHYRDLKTLKFRSTCMYMYRPTEKS